VTCAVVVAMMITGVLVGVKFHLDSTNHIVKVALAIAAVAVIIIIIIIKRCSAIVVIADRTA